VTTSSLAVRVTGKPPSAEPAKLSVAPWPSIAVAFVTTQWAVVVAAYCGTPKPNE
jgi:hypothetical protein